MTSIIEFFNQNEALWWWLGVGSALMFVGSLFSLPYLVSWIPEDYFTDHRSAKNSFSFRHPALRISGLVLKNLFGLILIAAGIAMLILPGQGILTIVIGLLMMNFPGKRSLEIWLIGKPTVSRLINWMRARHGRPPLQVPGEVEQVPVIES